MGFALPANDCVLIFIVILQSLSQPKNLNMQNSNNFFLDEVFIDWDRFPGTTGVL